ncbi:MAG: radical SAM protein [Desulfobulbaceae bacterium]|nr:radical SAM protein [Desulfobulbaceae bacterium]
MPINNIHEFFVQLHLTERCNLNCTHCYQTGDKTKELSRQEIRDSADEISDMLKEWAEAYQLQFSPSLNITGGEPLLRRDLFEILADLQSYEFAVYLLTNGTLITEKNAAALSALGVQGVQVSIEGPEKIHDRIRGKGSFSASCRGILHLLAAGLDVTMNATLSQMNAGMFRDLMALASSLGVQQLGFSRLVPSGRGADMADSMLAPEKVKDIYETIFSLPADGFKIVTGDPVASQMRVDPGMDDGGMIAVGGCAAGVSGLTILPDGTIVPCRRMPVPLGNIREDSLREIWVNSEILAQLRDRDSYQGKCGSCRRWAHCRGCRAIAYAAAGIGGAADFLADDPQCFISDQDESGGRQDGAKIEVRG